jgi:hypothetical protein
MIFNQEPTRTSQHTVSNCTQVSQSKYEPKPRKPGSQTPPLEVACCVIVQHKAPRTETKPWKPGSQMPPLLWRLIVVLCAQGTPKQKLWPSDRNPGNSANLLHASTSNLWTEIPGTWDELTWSHSQRTKPWSWNPGNTKTQEPWGVPAFPGLHQTHSKQSRGTRETEKAL